MDLILWRHADAEDGVPDLERELTAKGAKQAKKVAAWLATRLPKSARVMASPAKRAQQTARALAGKFETVAALGTGTDAKSVLAAVGWPADDDVTVVAVGHQPALGQAAALALTGKPAEWSLKKGALVWLAWRGRDGRAQLRAAISPDLL